MIAKPCQFPELGDLGSCPLGGSSNGWGARCVDKFLPGKTRGLVLLLEPRRNSRGCDYQLYQAPRRTLVNFHM